jgi:glyoxylase-like metal-dependent hydrolase (beta-lactamase superfamily II)
MRVREYGKYLVQLTQYPRLFPVNFYLVREDDGFTLVDAGLPGLGSAIIKAAQDLGALITRIALTHAHLDHVGSLDELAAALPHAEILVGSREARLLRGDMRLDAGEAPLKGSWKKSSVTPMRLLAPGDRIGSLEVIAASGHTPGHLAFFDRRDGSLIAGDAFQTRPGLAVSGVLRWAFPFPALATWDARVALASAERLRSLNPERLAVGHGEVLEAPGAGMDMAIAEARRKVTGDRVTQ